MIISFTECKTLRDRLRALSNEDFEAELDSHAAYGFPWSNNGSEQFRAFHRIMIAEARIRLPAELFNILTKGVA